MSPDQHVVLIGSLTFVIGAFFAMSVLAAVIRSRS